MLGLNKKAKSAIEHNVVFLAIFIAKNQQVSVMTKQIDIHHHYVREVLEGQYFISI
jgi:hypothetical protein